jgi:hypothetical protein
MSRPTKGMVVSANEKSAAELNHEGRVLFLFCFSKAWGRALLMPRLIEMPRVSRPKGSKNKSSCSMR